MDQSKTLSPTRRRRYTALEKQTLVLDTYQPGNSVSMVARRHGIKPVTLYRWRKLLNEGGLKGIASGDKVVSVKELKKLKARVKELEAALGRKTMDVEILKEAVKLGREKKLISRQSLVGLDDFE